MILVTGAAGKTGTAVIRALNAKGAEVRAFVRQAVQREVVMRAGAHQVAYGDLADRLSVEQAMGGVKAVYHICPNVEPRELMYAQTAIAAAASAGVRQFGYHSVLHPQTESMIHHWQKLRVEEVLFASGLPFTIMQPCAYMQNLLAHRDSIMRQGLITVPYAVEAQLSMVDLQDVAKAVATVLTEPGHVGAIYELAGPEPLSHLQVASILTALIRRTVRAERTSIEQWARSARKSNLSEYAVEALSAMFVYYDRHGFVGNPNVLAYLLNQSPRDFEQFARREMVA